MQRNRPVKRQLTERGGIDQLEDNLPNTKESTHFKDNLPYTEESGVEKKRQRTKCGGITN